MPESLPMPEATIALPTINDFDPVAAGENIAKETIVFECHVRAPGFTKPIRADLFIQNVSKMTEEEIAALPPGNSCSVQRYANSQNRSNYWKTY